MSQYHGEVEFEQQYNAVSFLLDLYLDNSNELAFESESTRYYINPASVLSFVIEDSFTNWASEGYILLSYLPDDSSGLSDSTYGQNNAAFVQGARQNGKMLKSYQFRADGFDTLRFAITPNLKDGENTDGSYLNVTPWDPKWTLSYLFSVYEVEDVNDVPGIKGPLSTYIKCIKLYLKDLRLHILRTTNLEYSTSLSEKVNYNSGLANGTAPQGTLTTGRIINELLNFTLREPSHGGDPQLANTIPDPEDGEKWDLGSSELFYTSPAQWFASDDVDYVHGQHVSSKKLTNDIADISILNSKRNPGSGKDISEINLLPVSTFFESATEKQIEHFFVTSHTSLDANLTRSYMAPFPDEELRTFKFGQIVSYSFVDMSPTTNSMIFSNTPVYSSDLKTRIFEAKFQNNTVDDARKFIGENYISKLHKQGGTTELFLPALHKQKQLNNNIYPTFSLNHDQVESAMDLRQKNGITQLLYTGLFQTTCICFTTFGLTLRQPGTIIGIDNANKAEESDYNTKLYGQWFVVKVAHSFETGAYMNLIFAVKLHRYKSAKLSFGNTY